MGSDLSAEKLIAFARRAAKRRRDQSYYQRHCAAINARRRERYREMVEQARRVDEEVERARDQESGGE